MNITFPIQTIGISQKLGETIMTTANSWWFWAIRGVFAIIFGVLAMLFPGDALQALVYIFGAYALIDGAMTIYNSIANRATNWGWHMVEGIVNILAGLAAFFLPLLTGLTLLLVIGFWAVVTGFMQIVAAWRLRKEIDNEVWLGLAGLMSVIFGIYIFINPLAGALATAMIIGIYSILFGIFLLALAMRFRGIDDAGTQIPLNNTGSVRDTF